MKPHRFVPGFTGMLFTVATTFTQSDAKALFHSGSPERNVGIHYWLQTSDGRRLTERTAASVKAPLTLHLRSNIGGFVTVWTTLGNGRLLTPDTDGFPGHLIQASSDYVVGGGFRLSASEAEGRVVVLFARSQTEQVRRVDDAILKISRLLPAIVKQPDEAPGSAGTYVVNRDGNPLGVEISITR